MPIKKGNKVKIQYEGTLDDGTVFDSSERHGEPLEFEVGSGNLIAGFDDAVVGMKKGEEKEFKLEPSEAYGEHKPELVKKVPLDQLPKGDELKAGMMLMLTLPNGMQLTALVAEIDEETVTLDLNHPLAGKTLNFKVKIVDVAS